MNFRKLFSLSIWFSFFISFLFIFSTKSYATHVVGGTVTYKYVGNNKYAIEFMVYRDCSKTTNAPFRNPLYFSVKGASASSSSTPVINNRGVYLFATATKVQSNVAACAGTTYCVEKGIYRDTITLGTDTAGYHLWHSDAARNGAILNYNVGSPSSPSAGSTLYTFIPARKYNNSSPNLVKDPTPSVCQNKKTVFNAGFFDSNGDSLVFSLVQALNGNMGNGNNPTTTLLSFNSTYSLAKPFGSGSNAVTIDKSTGEITVEPKSTGNYILVVEVKDYRVDPISKVATYMGKVRVDLQFIVVSCGSNPEPKFKTDTVLARYIEVGKKLCLDVSAYDSVKTSGAPDTLTLSATGSPLGKDPSFPKPYATFTTKKDTLTVSSQFCWTPSCEHVTYSGPHIVTFKTEDNRCNTVEKTYSIYVTASSKSHTPVLQCADITSSATVNLKWKSPPKDTSFFKYNIYRRKIPKESSFTLIKSITDINQLTWTDSSAFNVNDTSYMYFLTSTNSCGIEVKGSDTLQTILISKKNLTYGNVEFSWNKMNVKYKDSFFVLVDRGSGFVHHDTIKSRTYIFPYCQENIKVKVIGINTNTGCYANSGPTPLVQINDTINPVKNKIINATVIAGNKAEITFSKSISDDVNYYYIYRSENGGTFTKIDSVKHITSSSTYKYKDNSAKVATDNYCYDIKAVDYCGNSVFYGPHCIIQLSSTTLNKSVKLNWTKYKGYNIISYNLERKISGSWVTVKTFATDTNYTDTGLACIKYNYRIKAVENGGGLQTTYSDSLQVSPFDTILPNKPIVEYVSVNTNNTSVNIKFNTVSNNDVVKYEVYGEKNGSGKSLLATLRISHPQSYIFTHSGITPSKDSYCYSVIAIDTCGNKSAEEKHCPVTLIVTSENLAAKLNWTKYKAGTVTKYYVERNDGNGWNTVDSTNATDSLIINKGLKCNLQYGFRIRTKITGTSSFSYSDTANVKIFDTIAPDAPVIQFVSVTSPTTIDVKFNKSVDADLKEYKIYASVNGSSYSQVGTVKNDGSNIYTYSHTSLNTTKNTYCYYIKAADTCSGNTSVASSTHCAMQLSGVAGNLTSNLSWTQYKGYSVEKYYIQRLISSIWSTIDSTISTKFNYTDTKNLDCNVPVSYRIRALDQSTNKFISLSDTVVLIPFDTIRPAKVNIKYATVKNGTSIELAFDKVIDKDVNRYAIYSSKNGGSFSLLTTIMRPATSTVIYNHSGINPLTDTYCYQVKALDSCSNNISLTSETHCPVQLSGSQGNYSNSLNWSTYKGFTVKNYVVENLQGSNWVSLASLNNSTTSYKHEPIQCNKIQYYRIRSIEDNGDNMVSFSDTISLTPFDTVRPKAPEIQYASILSDGKIYVKWKKSPDTDVKEYRIFYKPVTSSVWTISDTVGNIDEFTLKLKPGNTTGLSHCIMIKAVDSCVNNISDASKEHCTVGLIADTTRCNQQIFLNWSAYKGWTNGVSNYKIYKKEQSGSESLLRTLSGTNLSFVDSAVSDTITYCYRIEAVQQGGSYVSSSPINCVKTYEITVPEIFSASKITTSATNGQVLLKWKSVASSRFYSYYQVFYKKEGSSGFNLLQNNIPVTQDSLIHKNLNTQDDDHNYYLVIVDSCGNKTDPSVIHKTTNLYGSVGQLTHQLWWTSYKGWLVKNYDIERLENGVFKTISTVPGTDTAGKIFPAPCNYNLFYRIKAIDAKGNYAYSDTIGRQAIDNIPANAPVLQNVSVQNGSSVKIDFKGADSLDMYQYVIQRAVNGSWTTAGRIAFTMPSDQHGFTDNINTLNDYLSYTVISLDSCLNATSSDTFNAIQLKGKAMNQANNLHWNPFKGYQIANYHLMQYVNNSWQLLAELNATDTSFYHDSLHCYLSYYYKIVGKQASGSLITLSDSIELTPFDTIIPPSASIRYATVQADHSVKIEWDYDIKSDVKYFEVWRELNNGGFNKIADLVFDSIYTDTAINPQTDHASYYIISIDSCNSTHRSTPSDTDRIMLMQLNTGACVPLNKLSWNAYKKLQNGTSNINIYRKTDTSSGWINLITIGGNVTNYVDSAVQEGFWYCYKVEAVDTISNYKSISDSFCITPWVFPAPDTALMVISSITKTGITDGEISIRWEKAPAADTFARGYNIYHKVNDTGTYSLIHKENDLSVNTFIHTGINSSINDNYYLVKVFNLCDVEGEKSIAHKPVNLNVVNKNLEVVLTWPQYVGSPVKKYELFRSVNGGSMNLIGIFTSPDTTYTDTNVFCEKQYSYRVNTILTNNMVSLSDTVIVTAFDTIAPQKPDIYAASTNVTDKTSGSITVSYLGNNEKNRNGYKIYRSVNNESFILYKTLADTMPGLLTWTDTALNTVSNTYSYYITAIDSCQGNESVSSDTHTVVNLIAKAYSKYIKLDWTPYKGWNKWNYVIEKRKQAGNWEIIDTLDKTTSSYSDSAVKCFVYYDYRIRSIEDTSIWFSLSNIAGDTAFEVELPLISQIIKTTVTQTGIANGSVNIQWNASSSNDVEGYNLFRSEDGINWQLIGVKLPVLNYNDINLNTYNKPYYYRIQAEDSCGNLSVDYSNIHKTIVTKAKAGNQQVSLNWNAYQGWKVKEYQVYRDGNLYATVPGTQLNYIDTLVLCINSYKYHVDAVADSIEIIITQSNNDSARPFDLIPPAQVYLNTVSVSLPNKEIELKWDKSASFDAKNYLIYRRSSINGQLTLIDSTANLYYVDKLDSITHPDCYFISTQDYCGNISSHSNKGCIILLTTKNKDGYNELHWNGYADWKDGVAGYNIYKKEDSLEWKQIGNTKGTALTFNDKMLTDHIMDYCYQVEAIENPGQHNAVSRSTTSCAHQDPIIHMPNTFTPNTSFGLNDKFGPVGMYIKNYQLQVFNRWGQMVYESKSAEGWDGKIGGEKAPEGVYFYILNVDGLNPGKTHYKGNLTIIW